MCTVSFYKNQHKVIITSNRDEHINRPIALAPQAVSLGNNTVYCPIDPQSNGTWFGVKNDGSVYVLLNGADKKHLHNPPYRKSRGLVLMDIMNSDDVEEVWGNSDLEHIEPFTVVVFQNDQLIQLRWNGDVQTLVVLDSDMAHIWSSATLYTEEIVLKRKLWFEDLLSRKNRRLNEDDLIQFHTHTEKNDSDNGLIINRKNTHLTKNITQCIIEKNQFTLIHFDLIGHVESKIVHHAYPHSRRRPQYC